MSVFIQLINFLIRFFGDILVMIINVLPDTPFNWSFVQCFLNNDYVKFVNYFVPFDTILAFMEVYVTAVAVWYVYRWVLRFIKYIS